MNIDEFDYELPEELIAQTPLKERSSSRFLVLNKNTGEIEDRHFSDVIDYLNPGDTLVVNDTKVIPARLIGEKEDTKAAKEQGFDVPQLTEEDTLAYKEFLRQ